MNDAAKRMTSQASHKKAKNITNELTNDTRKAYDKKDQQHFARLESIIQQAGYSLADVLQHFPAFIQRRDMPRFLAHYELFKQIQHMPGSIAELGIFRGSGFFTWSNLLESFCPSDRTRKVYGFDHFKGLVEHDKSVDGNLTPWLSHVVGELTSKADIMQAMIDLHNDDNLLPGVERCTLINGDVCETVSQFVTDHPGLRLSLLYFDIGLYEPTIKGLQHLYPLVMPGGIVAFNGYGMRPWEGEAKAIETYFAELGKQPVMSKFDFSPLPHAYFIKDGN